MLAGIYMSPTMTTGFSETCQDNITSANKRDGLWTYYEENLNIFLYINYLCSQLNLK